jgi:hypothetical protein
MDDVTFIPDWPELWPLSVADLAEVDTKLLPESVRVRVDHVAETRMTDPALPYAAEMATAAVISAGRSVVHLDDTWTEPIAGLWWFTPALSGDAKSPAMRPAISQLKDFEDARELVALDRRRSAKAIIIIEKKALEIAKKDSDLKAVTRCVAAIEQAETEADASGRIRVSDATTEAIAELMGVNGGHVAAIDPEGTLAHHVTGMYAKQPNIDVLLKGWDGDEYHRDRTTKQRPIYVERAMITMAVAIQDRVAGKLVSSDELWDRGLLSRALWTIPKPMAGRRLIKNRPATDDAVLDRIRYPQPGTIKVQASTAARELFYEWHDDLEKRFPHIDDDERSIAAKMRANVLRIAGLFTILEADTSDGHLILDDETLDRAKKLGEFHLQHGSMIRDYYTADQRAQSLVVRAVARFKDAGPRHDWTIRELVRTLHKHKRAGGTQEVIEALRHLTECGYVMPVEVDGFGDADRKIGKASPAFIVNPEVTA